MLVHVKGDITWIGVYSKTFKKTNVPDYPVEEFWQRPGEVPVDELPPELDEETLKLLESGKTVERQSTKPEVPDEGRKMIYYKRTLDAFLFRLRSTVIKSPTRDAGNFA